MLNHQRAMQNASKPLHSFSVTTNINHRNRLAELTFNDQLEDLMVKNHQPLTCGVMYPQKWAQQCMCSGVYLSIRCRMLWSSMKYMGMVW